MAGSDSQRQFLSLIRDFAAEKSQGERRISSQKKRIEELQCELEAASTQLGEAKREREIIEQELKGYEVELSMNQVSIQTLESRNAQTSKEIAKLGSELEALKLHKVVNYESAVIYNVYIFGRDGFIAKMFELNSQIRISQKLLDSIINAENSCETKSVNALIRLCFSVVADDIWDSYKAVSVPVHIGDSPRGRSVNEDKSAVVMCPTNKNEQQHKAEQLVHEQVQQELTELEKKASLMESIMAESMELQGLSKYPLSLSGFFNHPRL
ncbi:spindle assembly abnormal protein 6 [Dorcoceras hygrometricum]|uniref:Spindle assembly abnormal protein 6 n=1 Tax=Dorcoceras hygrometricum TaxID=472368 RepID=A0A2Z7D867_9LAMI|nr:spindle assembly abnormal protein 6 [Dorcoceras hygrometricum]